AARVAAPPCGPAAPRCAGRIQDNLTPPRRRIITMQNWAKRGLQTALVTGGLLMLGTGIASAEENVNPDKPASPLDVSLTVPVKVGNNAVGTPFGQKHLPEIDKRSEEHTSELQSRE